MKTKKEMIKHIENKLLLLKGMVNYEEEFDELKKTKLKEGFKEKFKELNDKINKKLDEVSEELNKETSSEFQEKFADIKKEVLEKENFKGTFKKDLTEYFEHQIENAAVLTEKMLSNMKTKDYQEEEYLIGDKICVFVLQKEFSYEFKTITERKIKNNVDLIHIKEHDLGNYHIFRNKNSQTAIVN